MPVGEKVATGLGAIFYPRSVAVVGASARAGSGTNIVLLEPLLQRGFRGKVYPVNPRAESILGLPSYPSLRAVPGTVDYVICALAAPQILPLLEECAEKGVKALHIFSAGFGEGGNPEGKRLEREIVLRARERGIRVIGPNCFGVSCPESGMCSLPDIPAQPGRLALASQSSAIAVEFVDATGRRGVRFSKAVCYGNGADLNETDFLEYFRDDPATDIIAFYLEGIRNRRFFPLLGETARRKPVIILKGGVSGAGSRAASSHTGSLVGRGEVWWHLCRQLGALACESFDEMVDLAVTAYLLPSPQGKRAAIVVFGGGSGVRAADDCERGGLAIPPLDPETQTALARLMPPVGTSTANPVDVSPGVIWVSGPLFRACQALTASPSVDLVLVQLMVPSHSHRAQPQLIADQLEALVRAKQELPKPVVGINHFTGSPEAGEMTVKALKACSQAGVPVYFSYYSAARAVSRFLDYLRWREAAE